MLFARKLCVSMRTKMLRFGTTLGTTLMLLGFSAGQKALRNSVFVSYAKGSINNPNMTFQADSKTECFSICIGQLTCAAVSISPLGGAGNKALECKVALEEFTWTYTGNSTLFLENIGPLNGYTLATDGRFYKYDAADYVKRTMLEARLECQAESSSLVVPYPKFRRDVILQKTGTNLLYWVGLFLTNTLSVATGVGRWITEDGFVFSSSRNATTDQPWRGGFEPSGDGKGVYEVFGQGWNDCDHMYLLTVPHLCWKQNIYRRMGNSTKYYKMHYEKANVSTAADTCAREGAKLASIVSQQDYDAIEGYRVRVDPFPATQWSYGFLVGGSDKDAEGTWKFPDGTSLLASDPKLRWYSGEPNGTTSANYMAYQPGGFGDVSDGVTLPFLCQIG